MYGISHARVGRLDLDGRQVSAEFLFCGVVYVYLCIVVWINAFGVKHYKGSENH